MLISLKERLLTLQRCTTDLFNILGTNQQSHTDFILAQNLWLGGRI